MYDITLGITTHLDPDTLVKVLREALTEPTCEPPRIEIVDWEEV